MYFPFTVLGTWQAIIFHQPNTPLLIHFSACFCFFLESQAQQGGHDLIVCLGSFFYPQEGKTQTHTQKKSLAIWNSQAKFM